MPYVSFGTCSWSYRAVEPSSPALSQYDFFTTRPPETLLTERAADALAAGPVRARELVATVCQLPGVPEAVAEHLAVTLLAGHRRFVREPSGLWALRREPVAPRLCSGQPLDALSFVVVDVESTGASPQRGHRITEIAAVVVREGRIADRFESLINPERPIPRYITYLTNISWEMVKDAPRFADVCADLLGVMGGHVFTAHNAGFDWRFVAAEVQQATGQEIDGPRLCTVRLARKLLPQLRRRSLDYVTAHYGVEITARHRAMGDALATAEVLLHLLRDARDRGCTTWSDLERLGAPAAARRRRRRATAMPHAVQVDTTA